MSMKFEYRIEPFSENTPVSAQDIALLHAELLPRSPIAELGSRFMKRFYYNDLPREGYIFGAVAYVDGCPAGFVVATCDSSGFMKTALRQLWWKFAWEMCTSILLHPQCIRSIWETLNIMRSRKTVETDKPEGEILSFGVLSNYLGSRFIYKTGLHVADDLFHEVINQLQTKDLSLVRAIVDADNSPAQLFYRGLGWTLEQSKIPGWKIPSVEFVWRPGNDVC